MIKPGTMVSTYDDGHDHHLGLAHDLKIMAERNMQRRQALSWLLAGGSAALFVGCGGGSDDTASSSSSSGGASSSSSSSGGSAGSCIANATETGGPFPSDGSNTVNGMVSNVLQQSGVVRSDIRGSFGSSTNTAGGVQLDLAIQVVNSNNSCANLAGYAVYIWHCTREGGYSLYSNGITAENYLRGVQETSDSGIVNFTTIFPGCYSGRYPHIHIEVYPSQSMATLYTNRVLTSQFAMPREVCSTVYAGATGYGASVSNLAAVSVASDGVFGDNSTAQIAQMTPSLSGTVAAGYTGTILVGVPV
jgi:protocatechuate 3,4-dioxygenase beta subunit